MEFQSIAKDVKVSVDFEGFSSQDKVFLPFDQQRYQQVILNFLSNALKFTEKGGDIKILIQYIQ